jgi:hypothetical protein
MQAEEVRAVLARLVDDRLTHQVQSMDRGSRVSQRCAVVDAEAESLIAAVDDPAVKQTIRAVHAQMIREAILGRIDPPNGVDGSA